MKYNRNTWVYKLGVFMGKKPMILRLDIFGRDSNLRNTMEKSRIIHWYYINLEAVVTRLADKGSRLHRRAEG
jgi:hypothetical protein